MNPFPTIVEAWKSLSGFSGWSVPEPETNYMWFDAPLETAGVTQAGVSLHGGCYRDQPDRHVTFELRITKPGARRCIPLARLDWRSLSGGHSNGRLRGSEWSGRRVSNSHLHAFEMNWVEHEGRMRTGGLPFAMEIPSDVQSFASARAFAGNRFRISNIDLVLEPEWVYGLL